MAAVGGVVTGRAHSGRRRGCTFHGHGRGSLWCCVVSPTRPAMLHSWGIFLPIYTPFYIYKLHNYTVTTPNPLCHAAFSPVQFVGGNPTPVRFTHTAETSDLRTKHKNRILYSKIAG
ncbi:hypothetical protein OF001_U20352 [Pseudomonas sp. OF001]|nr:hypothetical protein OF001_U20352 [Pseudomonas sp. OF001]